MISKFQLREADFPMPLIILYFITTPVSKVIVITEHEYFWLYSVWWHFWVFSYTGHFGSIIYADLYGSIKIGFLPEYLYRPVYGTFPKCCLIWFCSQNFIGASSPVGPSLHQGWAWCEYRGCALHWPNETNLNSDL